MPSRSSYLARLALVACLALGSACSTSPSSSDGGDTDTGTLPVDAHPDATSLDAVAPDVLALDTVDAPDTADVANARDVRDAADIVDVTPPGTDPLGSNCRTDTPETRGTCAAGLICHSEPGLPGNLCTHACTQDAQCGTTNGVPNVCTGTTASDFCLQGCDRTVASACRRDWACDPGNDPAMPSHGVCLPDCRQPDVAPCPSGTVCNPDQGNCVPTPGDRTFYQTCGGTAGACDAQDICSNLSAGAQTQCFADCSTTGVCPTQPPGAQCTLITADGRHACAIPCTPGGAACPIGNRCTHVGTGLDLCLYDCTAGSSCTPDNPCHAGSLTCGNDPACIDTGVNVADGTTCGTNQQCSAGACIACVEGASCTPSNPCHAGHTTCSSAGATCVDEARNVADGTTCGMGMVCHTGACNVCVEGMPCTPTTVCHAGTTTCASGVPVCTDTGTASMDGTPCGVGRACTGGTCGCAAGYGACGTGCVDLQNDPTNCGSCGLTCPGGRACASGACACPAGQSACGTACYDFTSDRAHCGSCTTACPLEASCIASACVCPAPSVLCGTVCVDPRTNDANCNACGAACPTGQTCFASACHDGIAPMPEGRDQHGAARLPDGRFIVVGGVTGGYPGNPHVYIYDPTSNTWSFGADLPTPRAGLAVVAGQDGRVYAIGGRTSYSSNAITNVLEIYDPASNTWSTGTPDPIARERVAGTLLPDGRIVVVGSGTCGTGYSYLVEAYAPATNSWSSLARFPTPIAAAAIAMGGDGRLYVFGGDAGCIATDAIFALDLRTNTWTRLATPMPFRGLGTAAVTATDGSIYGTGGFDQTIDSRGTPTYYWRGTTWRLDPSTGVLTLLADMPTRRGFLAGVFDPSGSAYFIGGAWTYGSVSDPYNPMPSFAMEYIEAYSPSVGLWRR